MMKSTLEHACEAPGDPSGSGYELVNIASSMAGTPKVIGPSDA